MDHSHSPKAKGRPGAALSNLMNVMYVSFMQIARTAGMLAP
jgi:hypothetical protein